MFADFDDIMFNGALPIRQRPDPLDPPSPDEESALNDLLADSERSLTDSVAERTLAQVSPSSSSPRPTKE